MSHNSLLKLVVLAAVILGVFFTELGAPRLWDRDEPRNARASHEMLERGDWIVPTFNGSLRDHKPILLYWAQMLSYLAIGESEFAARLPSVICALLTVMAVAVLASRLSGRKRGISPDGYWTAGALATCLLFVMAGRAATPDACLIAFSTLGVAALVIASIRPALPYSSGQVGMARWLPAAFGYTMLGLAALAKGPVGIILPLTVVHVWWLICNRLQSDPRPRPTLPNSSLSGRCLLWITILWKTFSPWQCCRALWALRAIPGLLLCLLVAAPWYVAVGIETDGAFLRGFFLDHNLGRAVGSMEGHSGSILFYPLAMLVGIFPWSLWLIPILLWCRSASRQSLVQRQMVVLAGTWVAVYVVAFSIASTKLPSYITPCYAGAALAIGSFMRQFESTWSLPSIPWRRAAYGLTLLVGVAISVGIYWLSARQSMPLLATATWAGVAIVVVGCMGLLWEKLDRVRWVPTTWFLGAAVFQILLFGYGAKSIDAYRTDLQLLAKTQLDSPSTHWLSIGGLEPSWVHYLNLPIAEVTSDVREPASWDRVAEFLGNYPDGRVIVVGDEANQHLAEFQPGMGADKTLTPMDAADRFLRSGRLVVYELRVEQTLVRTETAQPDAVPGPIAIDEASKSMIPVQMIGHEREVGLEPVLDVLPELKSEEPSNEMRSETHAPSTNENVEQHPNPLRQKQR